jgi:ribonuclease HI
LSLSTSSTTSSTLATTEHDTTKTKTKTKTKTTTTTTTTKEEEEEGKLERHPNEGGNHRGFWRMKAHELLIWTDGSCSSNGEAGARGGIGVYFSDGWKDNIAERLPGLLQTNQRAELWAIKRALDFVLEQRQFTKVTILTDSNYAIGCCTLWLAGWKSNNWHNSKKRLIDNYDIISVLDQQLEQAAAAQIQIVFQKVAGHSEDIGNCRADELARLASSRPDKEEIKSG